MQINHWVHGDCCIYGSIKRQIFRYIYCFRFSDDNDDNDDRLYKSPFSHYNQVSSLILFGFFE